MAITRIKTGSSFTSLVKSDSFLAGNPARDVAFIGVIGGSATEVSFSSAVDSSENVYIFGRSNSSGSYRQSIAKYNKTGTLQWQKQLSNNTHPSYYECWGTVDTSGNPIAYNSTTDGANGGVVVTKLTSAGAITWQKALGTSNDAFADTVVTDSSGNIYATGPMNDGAGYKMMLIKYNSSGTYQWQMKTNGEGHGVAVDSSGNVYGGGFAGGTYGLQLNKYSAAGSLLLQTRTNGQYGYDTYGGKVVCDSAGNSYSAGAFRQSSGTGYEFGLIKRNSSGTIQWQRVLTNSSSSYGMVITSLATDSSDNIYGTAYTDASGTNAVIAKWNSSGTLQWQRKLTVSGGCSFSDVKINSSGTYMYISGTTNASGNSDYMLLKLPTDGTLTGTYTVGSYSYTYATSTFTEAAYSGTDVSATLTASGGALGQSTPTNTIADTTFTNTVTTI